ncbi:uncharacterized protein PpBr36_09672 [Pyricularia pennisetigena]|uniref:uncharacterized protein n=1 Tax=Pyricularia pennisetigena TaxID=1578925 RepID=UPI00115373A5|nr:uncharacterized protein PpBr36_09672 [Pyricularia pennisetigena]TLS22404.1 hypothetical protein PpBr36_09672 [Pyricularia pennisetigena]
MSESATSRKTPSETHFKKRLREWCGLFITVHDKRAYFLHQTAREFLLPIAVCLSGPTITKIWAHILDIYQAHAVLAESCTVYLNLPTERKVVTEMLDYSAQHWSSHFREADVENAVIISFASNICNPNSNHYAAWSEIYRQFTRGLPKNATNLILASHFGHKGVVRMLVDTGKVDVDAKNKHGRTPLSLAAMRGHETVVRMLHEFIYNRSRHDPIPTGVSSLLPNSDPGLAVGRLTALKKRFATYHPTPNPQLSPLKYIRSF